MTAWILTTSDTETSSAPWLISQKLLDSENLLRLLGTIVLRVLVSLGKAPSMCWCFRKRNIEVFSWRRPTFRMWRCVALVGKHFGGSCRVHHQGEKNGQARNKDGIPRDCVEFLPPLPIVAWYAVWVLCDILRRQYFTRPVCWVTSPPQVFGSVYVVNRICWSL